ncbi:hypothetical protein JZ751_016325, partial [Albula glossodonta]
MPPAVFISNPPSDPNLEQQEEKQVSQCEEEQFSLGLMERPLSAGQVFLDEVGDQEHHLVDLLKNLLTTGASSCNTAHTEEEEEEEGKREEEKEEGERKMAGEEAPKNSRCQRKNGRRPHRTASCGSALSPAYRHGRWGRGYDLTVRGKSLDLVSRLPALCTELPLLAEDSGGGGAWDLDSGAKRSCIFAAVKPSNVDMERTKFFLSDYTYNPQFEYPHPAVRILEQALRRYGSYEKFELATGGSVLSKNKIKNHVKKYMEKEGVVGEIVVHLSEDLLSRASITVMPSRSTLTINVSTAREFWLEGMLRHEIGTHYFRGMNNLQQPWASMSVRRALDLKPHNPTEEGLASLHSVLHRKDPTLWRAALLYYTVHRASRLTFAELFHDLGRFLCDPNTRWDYCIRAKRGQTDTAQPGCFSKDQVYLDGILKLLRFRDSVDFQLLVCLGK